jgi:KaiC/GvpD/RAD55 family RecA-like ATPase
MDFEKNSNRDLQEWQVLRLSAMRLKRIAMEQNVCVVMVAQLTDQGTLQGSRAMKNEADLWINLEREQEEDKLDEMWPYNCYVNIKKARNCPDDTRIRFRYDGALMRFSDTPEQILDAMTKSREIKGFENDLMTGDEYDRLVKLVNGKTWSSNVPY